MQLEELPHQKWLEDQELTQRDIELLGFHQWMRNKTSLKSGTIVEYRKKIHNLMQEDAKLVVDREKLDTRQNTAVNKFEEYLDEHEPVSCGAEGDSSE